MTTTSPRRRSLGARASACDVMRSILSGAKSLKDIRTAERDELMECLSQGAEYMRASEPHKVEIAALMAKGGAA
jgi:hypothetical protein